MEVKNYISQLTGDTITVCATGHRPNALPWGYTNPISVINKMEIWIKKVCDFSGKKIHVLSGTALGIDTLWAIAAIRCRDGGYQVTLESAMPCENQGSKWPLKSREILRRILDKSDVVTLVNKKYSYRCMQERNEYMVNKSDLVVAFWNGQRHGGTYNCIQYAICKNKYVLYVDPAAIWKEGDR